MVKYGARMTLIKYGNTKNNYGRRQMGCPKTRTGDQNG